MDLSNIDDNNLFVQSKMNQTQLPTFTTIYPYFLCLLTILKCNQNKIETTATIETTNAIIEIWQFASLPHIPFKVLVLM